MIFHTGPTKPALVLLCCVGTWLAICSPSFGAPTATMIQTILKLLKLESKELFEDYHKKDAVGVPTDESLQLPCFTLGCEASTNISTIQAYLEMAKRLSDNRADTTNVTKRLDDIRCSNPPKPNISGPKDFYARKIFTLTVLKRFSDCMAELEAKDRVC
ncbi:interleukin-31 [Phodopus roborovskii]|uniref:Il31 protein n=1 Tax=Phodopus roborovskii TaxID=109678 RepID=A0AAU9YVU0_PHORO|nr:interleukin-31 [Phodopus roborovskii]CAH6778913.1 Il31 [Phodopus roborovskii]